MFEQYRNLKNLRIAGVHIHIGSPVYEIQPYVDAVNKIVALIDRLTERGHKIEWFDVGGGFGVAYESPEQAKPVTEHAKALVPLLKGKPYKIALRAGPIHRRQRGHPPHQSALPEAGRREEIRHRRCGDERFDPATLYEAYHHIWPTRPEPAI